MGDILFHLTPAEEALLMRAKFQGTVKPEERKDALLVLELDELNKLYSAPSDTQRSEDGYGVEDANKV